MQKNIQEFIEQMRILSEKLSRLSDRQLENRLHIIETYSEMADLMIGFEIEQYEESDSDSETESVEE
tara:strand:+ start:308 stop:508 length:201 start_codon:yes stop_codon:yes gene_type:complete